MVKMGVKTGQIVPIAGKMEIKGFKIARTYI